MEWFSSSHQWQIRGKSFRLLNTITRYQPHFTPIHSRPLHPSILSYTIHIYIQGCYYISITLTFHVHSVPIHQIRILLWRIAICDTENSIRKFAFPVFFQRMTVSVNMNTNLHRNLDKRSFRLNVFILQAVFIRFNLGNLETLMPWLHK